MLISLEYNLKFSNENQIGQSLQFSKGSTLITGKNGKGKSLNFEMVGYALFGSKALRGQAGDYKSMKVTLELEIQGKAYKIYRTKSKAEISHEGEMVASGTKAANNWVLRTLGYGFEVFRIAHWCAQGDIQALADMRPTERKAMIDSVAGLTQMDGLEKDLSVDARELRSGIDAAVQHLVKPMEPINPHTPPMEQLDSGLSYYQGQLEKWLTLSNLTAPTEPTKPQEPQKPEFPPEPEPLPVNMQKPEPPHIEQGMPGNINQLAQTEMQLDKRISEARALTERLEVYRNKYAMVAELPEGVDNREDLAASWEHFKVGSRIQELEAQSKVECPHCNGVFHLSQELETLRNQPHSFQRPDMTLAEWDEREAQIRDNEEFERLDAQVKEQNIQEIRDLLHKIRVLKSELIQYEGEYKQFISQQEQVQKLNASQVSNWQNQVNVLQNNYENHLKRYENDKARYHNQYQAYEVELQKYKDNVKAREEIVAKIPENTEATLRDCIRQLNEAKQMAQTYQMELQRYDQDLAKYNEGMASVEAQQKKLDEIGRARQALKEVKASVQSHLLPSLNTVASSLMSEMTGGELRSVEVGQDFEVVVDGQPMRTLSGSGKDLANLTLRIGLGRILTHRVLPLMMLDEIDSAMDDTRASYTWQCIERITPHIGQVLQASHKELDAQNRIEV